MNSRPCRKCGSEVPEVEAACLSCGAANVLPGPNSAAPGSLASHGKRLLNLVVDVWLFGVFVDVFLAVVFTPLALAQVSVPPAGLMVLLVGSFGALLVLFYGGFEALFGRTPAKFLTRTRVVMEDGSKPSFQVLAVRSLCRIIPFDALTFLGKEPVGWHDSLSKTRVVNG